MKRKNDTTHSTQHPKYSRNFIMYRLHLQNYVFLWPQTSPCRYCNCSPIHTHTNMAYVNNNINNRFWSLKIKQHLALHWQEYRYSNSLIFI